MRRTSAAFAAILVLVGAACQSTADAPRRRAAAPSAVDDLERRTFRWFWDTANPHSFLVPDRWPTKSFSSIAAVGFGLTAYCIGAERGYVTREQARDRVLATIRSLLAMPQGDQAVGVTQYRGFFYHFLDMETGARLSKSSYRPLTPRGCLRARFSVNRISIAMIRLKKRSAMRRSSSTNMRSGIGRSRERQRSRWDGRRNGVFTRTTGAATTKA